MSYFGSYGRKSEALSSNIFRSTVKNVDQNGKKIKEVYSTLTSLCHAWASENVPKGRSGCSMFFENGIIYSYGHHYEAAKIHTNKKGEKLVLVNSKDYSNSTQNHLSEIRSATSHLKNLRVPDVDPLNHDDNIQYLSDLITTDLENIFKIKGYHSLDSILNLEKSLNQYCNFFGKKVPFKIDEKTIDLIKECLKKKDLRRSSMREKRKINEDLKEAKLRAENSVILEKMQNDFPAFFTQWQNDEITLNDLSQKIDFTVKTKGPFGHEKRNRLYIDLSGYRIATLNKFKEIYIKSVENFKAGIGSKYDIEDHLCLGQIRFEKESKYAFLRVVENTVETSKGADVPLDHAIRLLKMILKNEAKKGERVGHFTLENIDDDPKGDKTINIGCHKILLSEAFDVLNKYL